VKRVLVVGLGRFGGGVAAARWFAERGHEVCVTDRQGASELAASVAAIAPLGVRFRLGGHDPADYDTADIIVVNPAVPFDDPLIAAARARGKRIVTEIGLTLLRLPGPVVAVTGTNGKSTTAALVAAMLEAAGVPAALGGNIGRPLLNETTAMAPGTVAVLEISSFQLVWLEHDRLAPAVAVVTNVTGDHLDRHPTWDHYVAAKRRLVEAVPREGTVILCEDDAVCRADYARCARGRVVWFGGRRQPPVPLEGLRLAGRHNAANAAAAAHAALAVGATPEGCGSAVRSFRPLPHRLERLRERAGVAYVDDSVSTTPEATAAAVEAFARPVILLAGGQDKGLDWAPLLQAARRAKAVVAYGETGPALHEALPASHLSPDLDRAVRRAVEIARAGDVVLLSPGFASYDQFPGFDARGARFRALVGGPL
jgi:UDP-N-acetylmuramoylalanine--D-glutamate ligase